MDLWHTLFFHRISRMNQRQSCLSDYSRNFAEFWPLANGSRPIYAPVVFFCHADFADDADFSSWDYFVPQISQIYTDFFHRKVFSSDFTEESEGILAYRITHGISQNFGRWPMAHALYICCCCFLSRRFRRWRRFFFVGWFCPTDFTDIHRFFMESLVNRFVRSQGVSVTTEQVASAKIRE